MPKNKVQKGEILRTLQERIGSVKSGVFVNFSGIPVKEIDQLRNNCKDEGALYMVAKKTLLRKVLLEKGIQAGDDESITGEVGVILGYTDEITPAKLASSFAKGQQKLKIVGGILEGKVIDEKMILSLSKLPSKQELLAKMVGSMAAPLSGLVGVMQGNLRSLVYVLNSVKEKKS